MLLAFALLAMVTAFVTVSWSANMDKASNALIQRELREVADTVFRRILYEIQEHSDGQTGTLEEFYGEWTGFRGLAKTKWQWYRYELIKREKMAAGTSDNDAESIFGDEQDDDDDPYGETDEEGAVGGIMLLEVTLHIRDVDNSDGAPLISLRTYIRPPDIGEDG